ncbi:MAG: hypothetical protein IJY79_08265 [Clostridia bacterium]|nr:hypothetical protein [Clostridia bacterium]
MLDTVRISNKNNTLFIAHRGLSGLELENTNAAFIAAANRGYFGIESDVRVTRDGRFVIYHDNTTGRLSAQNFEIEKTNYKMLESLNLIPQKNRTIGGDFKIPELKDYLSICAAYGKIAVLELKEKIEPQYIKQIYSEVQKYYTTKNVIFISFNLENLQYLRHEYPDSVIQLLSYKFDVKVLKMLKLLNFDLDINIAFCSKEVIDICHKNGIKVNCWTVDNPGDAERLIDYGVDYITTNILE